MCVVFIGLKSFLLIVSNYSAFESQECQLDGCIVWTAHNTVLGSKGSLVWQTVRATDRPIDHATRCGA